MKPKFQNVIALLTVGLLILSLFCMWLLWLAISSDDQVQALERYKLAVELFKVLITGIVVVLLGTILPLVFRLSREHFEHNKEARLAYSEAKTGVDYLHLRLSTASLDQAVEHIQSVHVKKHLAGSYPELLNFLFGQTTSEWSSKMYERLVATRKVLEENSEDWDQLLPYQRLAILKANGSSKSSK